MENLTKEQLNSMLKKIREGKDDDRSYEVHVPSMAMCYSIAMPRYYTSHYIGRHTCQNCNKEFGANLSDSIEQCRKSKYEMYCKDEKGIITSSWCPCFEKFLFQYDNNDKNILRYMKEHNLELYKPEKKEIKLSGTIRTGRFRSLVEDEEEREGYHFNRKLTYEEWCELNSSCLCKNAEELKSITKSTEQKTRTICFDYDRTYNSFEEMAQKYRDKGFDVVLKYNCEECSKERNETEFWFKLKDQTEYTISYPNMSEYRQNKSVELMNYIDYVVVLDFLSGVTSYIDIINNKEFSRSDDVVKKSQIDNAINKITGADIKYDKKEVSKYIKTFYGTLSRYNLYEDNDFETESCNTKIFELAHNILNELDNNYLFDMDKYFAFMRTIALYKQGSELSRFPIEIKEEIINKAVRSIVGLEDEPLLDKKTIEEWKKYNLPNERCESFKLENERILKIFSNIYEKNGDDFKIHILTYLKLLGHIEVNRYCLQYNDTSESDLNDIYSKADKIVKGEI